MLSIHWEKNNYIIPVSSILFPENYNAKIGDYYYLKQSLLSKRNSEKCYLGFLKLQSIKKDHYVFFSSKVLDKSNLFTYSQFNSYKVMINPLEKEIYSKEKNMMNCKNWIKLSNYNNSESKELLRKRKNKISVLLKPKKFTIKLQNCINIPKKKYLAIESMSSEHLYLEQDEIYNKIKLCAKSIGNSLIYFQPIDGSPPFTINSEAIRSDKVVKLNNASKKKNSSKGFFLSKKTLPGWR